MGGETVHGHHGAVQLTNAAGTGHDENHGVHAEELEFSVAERLARQLAAKKIQGASRSRNARMETKRRRELKKARSEMPAINEHGHANPATIKLYTTAPMVHQHHHEETFFELFYDLIIVVVLMKLSYLKYNFTAMGFFTVVAIFTQFWSVWQLLNIYVTMIHQEDGVHRLYYGLHVCMSFIMCIAIEHPAYPFFDFKYQAFFFIICGIIIRFFTVFMWFYFSWVDGKMRENPSYQKFLPKYSHEDVRKQVLKQAGGIMVAMVLLAITAGMEYAGDPDDQTRRLAATSYSASSYSASSYSAYGAGNKDGRASTKCSYRRLAATSSSYSAYSAPVGDDDCGDLDNDHTVTLVLWTLGVFVEQYWNAHTCIFDKLPFAGEYAGERMQAWLMLCFGESVIGLLIAPIYFDANSLKSIIVSFVMVFCLVTVYFDVTDADKFLHLFILRKEKWEAFWYCVLQCPFSMFVFLVGVALKSINYVEHVMHDFEKASGCTHSVEHVRRLSAAQDELAAALGESFGGHFGVLGPHGGGSGGLSGDAHRRLGASMSLDEYDALLTRCFNLLCYGAAVVQVCSVAVAYAMPTDQDMRKVHVSRLGSIFVVCFLFIVPPNIASLKTDCLMDFEDSMHRRLSGSSYAAAYSASSYSASSYSASSSAYHSYHDDPEPQAADGLTITEGLVITSLIVFVSFVVSLFSIDVDRSFTYKELEDAAHHGREPHLRTLEASKKKKKTLAERGGMQFVGNAFAGKKTSTVVPEVAGSPV